MPRPANPDRLHLDVRVSLEQRRALVELARQNERSLGGEIRVAIRRHIEREAAKQQEARAA